MPRKIKPLPLTDEVNNVLRQRIFSKKLAPGEWIGEQVLAKEFGVSRTPMREALPVLHGEGLVTLVPRRGRFVAQLTDGDFDEIYSVLAVHWNCRRRRSPSTPKQMHRSFQPEDNHGLSSTSMRTA